MKIRISSAIALALSCTAVAETPLPEIIVTAGFRDVKSSELGSSVTVLNELQLRQRAAEHLENVLNAAPNVNTAAGASRGRFFQIRGIGERSQYKEPLDSSVGLVVDGIDFSNLGLAGVLYDANQVEVLRGPQGTRYGSSAMAGMLYVKTSDPTDEPHSRLDASAGNYGDYSLGAVVSGPLSENLTGRLAMHRHEGDGFIENDFLGRKDTNNFDEQSLRGKLHWQANEDLSINITALHLDIDNGYDAFSLENNRHTRSDEPGYDRQKSDAGSIDARWDGNDSYSINVLASVEKSDLDYGFDWDWSDWDSVGVRGRERNQRNRDATSIDLRLVSKPGAEILGGASWVGGLYRYDRDVKLNYLEDADYYGAWTAGLTSLFNTRRYAAYGELEWPLSERLSLTLGGRLERFENEYHDSYGVRGATDDNLTGGNITLEYLISDNSMVYGSVSRGYKTGGINSDAMGKALAGGAQSTVDLLNDNLNYDAEKLTNYELGLKGSYLDDTLTLNVAAFYMDRSDMQAKVALEISTANWTEYRTNINGGKNYGLEVEADWSATEELHLYASIGILETRLGDLVILDVDSGLPVNQSGRDQAHAPGYQFNLGGEYQLTEHIAIGLQVEGKDRFYFSNSHDQRSDAVALLNSNVSYHRDRLTVSLWGRNLGNEDYQVRGFYWANNPNNGWINESYTQLGEPRVFGVSGSYTF